MPWCCFVGEWSPCCVFAECVFLYFFIVLLWHFSLMCKYWMVMLMILLLLLSSGGAPLTSGSPFWSWLQPVIFLFCGIGCYRISYKMSCSCLSLKFFNKSFTFGAWGWLEWVEKGSRDWWMRGIDFKCCLLVLWVYPLLFVFFFLKLTLLDECRGDHAGERHGNEIVKETLNVLT